MVDRPAPLLNFPLPNFQFGYQKPQENNFIQPPQIQQDENKDKRPTLANSGNKKRKPEQSQSSSQEKEPKKPVHLNHNFDEFIQATSPQSQLVENEDKIPIPVNSENKNTKPVQAASPQSQPDATTKPNEKKIDKKEKETKKPNHIDQKINESIKTTIPPKSTLNLNKTKSSPDNIIFPDEDDETISLSPIEILSTTPAVYSTTHKRIIPGLPSPDDDGDYNEDDKISNSALLSLVG